MQNRKVEDLKEPFKSRFIWFMNEWNKRNPTIQIFLVEWMRDIATQKDYVARWASKTMKSNHLTGQAADIAFSPPNKLYLDNRNDVEFIRGKLCELAHKYHLVNGYYDLNRGFDKCHRQNVELQKPIWKMTKGYEYALKWIQK